MLFVGVKFSVLRLATPVCRTLYYGGGGLRRGEQLRLDSDVYVPCYEFVFSRCEVFGLSGLTRAHGKELSGENLAVFFAESKLGMGSQPRNVGVSMLQPEARGLFRTKPQCPGVGDRVTEPRFAKDVASLFSAC